MMARAVRGTTRRSGEGKGVGGSVYDHPAVYEALHARGTAAEVDGLERIARRFVRRARPRRLRWLEPACGTGRYLRVLAGRGAACVGVDSSAAMVRYAGARVGGKGRVVAGDMRRIGGSVRGEFDVVFCMHNSVRHLRSDAELSGHLRSVAGVLRAGGVYLVGVSLFRAAELMASEEMVSGRRGGLSVTGMVSCEPVVLRAGGEGVERVTSVVVVRRGEREEVLSATYDLWCGDVRRWWRIVGRAGMQEIAVVDERGADLPAGRAGYGVRVLAVKR